MQIFHFLFLTFLFLKFFFCFFCFEFWRNFVEIFRKWQNLCYSNFYHYFIFSRFCPYINLYIGQNKNSIHQNSSSFFFFSLFEFFWHFSHFSKKNCSKKKRKNFFLFSPIFFHWRPSKKPHKKQITFFVKEKKVVQKTQTISLIFQENKEEEVIFQQLKHFQINFHFSNW